MIAFGLPLAVTRTRPERPTAAKARPGWAENSREASHFVFMAFTVVQLSCMSRKRRGQNSVGFRGANQFGIGILSPGEFLRTLENRP